MDTRDPKTNASSTNSELGRHQRVLDAYLAHTGGDPLPPPGLDVKLLALAASSVKVMTKAPHRAEKDFASTTASEISSIKTDARSRRRHWPFALAASVATIGFATILARNGLLETPSYRDREPTNQAGRYEAKSVAQDQAPVATAPLAIETPTPLLEDGIAANRDQAVSVSAMAPAEDKAKLSSTSDAQFERAAERALGRVPPAPENAASTPADSGSTLAAAAAKSTPAVAVAKSEADRAKPASAPLPAVVSVPASEEPVFDAAASPAPAALPPAEVSQAYTAEPPSRRRGATAAIPNVYIPAENDAAETVAEEKPKPSAPTQAQAAQAAQAVEAQPGTTFERSEMPQAGAIAPIDDAANSKKDEFALDARGPPNLHEKTYVAIRALRDVGKLQQAKAMLARFRKAYPLEIVPADLKALEKIK